MAGKVRSDGNARIIAVLFISFFVLGLPNATLGAAWPSMYKGLGVSDSYLGIITMIIMGVSIIGSTFSGYLGRRYKTSMLIIACVLMISAPLLGFGLLMTFWLICIIVIPVGIALGLGEAVMNNHIANNLETKHMNWAHCFWGVSSTVGPIVLSLSIRIGSWQSGFFILGIVTIIAVAVMIVTLPKWKRFADVGVEEKDPVSVNLADVFRLRGVKLALASIFCYVIVEIINVLWGSTYLVMVKGMSPEMAARWIAIFSIGLTVGRAGAGFLTMKLSNHQLIRLGSAIIAIGIVLVLLPLGSSWYLIGFLLMGLGCSPIFPCIVQDTPLIVGEKYSQSLMGLQIAIGYVCGAVVPPMFGAIAAHTGYKIFPVFLAFALALTVIVIEIQYRRTPSLRGL